MTGVTSNGYNQIEVVTNSVEGWAGNKYYIASTATADGTTAYELFTDAGTTSANVFVTISEHQ